MIRKLILAVAIVALTGTPALARGGGGFHGGGGFRGGGGFHGGGFYGYGFYGPRFYGGWSYPFPYYPYPYYPYPTPIRIRPTALPQWQRSHRSPSSRSSNVRWFTRPGSTYSTATA